MEVKIYRTRRQRGYEAEDKVEAEMLTDEMLRGLLKRLIDEALDRRDEASFMQYTKEFMRM